MFKVLRKTSLYLFAVPLLLIFLGSASNEAVLVANHDCFPVMMNDAKINLYHNELALAAAAGDEKADIANVLLEHGYLDDTHVIMTADTRLNFLADWIDLRTATYSIGDLLLFLGEWLMSVATPVWFYTVVMRLAKKEEWLL